MSYSAIISNIALANETYELVDVEIVFNEFSAKEVEEKIARPLEKVISEISEVDHVYTASKNNQLNLSVQYKANHNRLEENNHEYEIKEIVEENISIYKDNIVSIEVSSREEFDIDANIYTLMIKVFFQILIPIILVVLISILLLRYLNINKIKNDNLGIIKDINEIKSNINSFSSILSRKDKDSLLLELKEKISEEYVKEKLLEINQKNKNEDAINSIFKSIIDRLKDEMLLLSRRGNLNLVIGISTAIIGLLILGSVLVDIKPSTYEELTNSEYLFLFLPRLSLVVLIEIFSYFFLRLYKSSISEIKYFHNEITTIESRYLALLISSKNEGDNNLNESIRTLLQSERNFILNEGQSTIDIETSKVDVEATKNILEKFTSVLNMKS